MFASGTQPLPSIHSPVFLLGLNFDTLICCGHNEWVEVSRMAIADIRESNFIPGVEFRSLYLTDDYSVRGGVSAAVTLAEQKVNAIVGGSASFIAIASLNYLTEFGMPYISPAATSDALSDKDSFPTFMRTVGPDRIQARVLADLATFYKWKKICSINFEADYESNLITRFGNALAEGSTLTRSTYTGKEDVPKSLEKLAQAKCKIIFAAMDYVNFGSIINEAKKQGLLGVGVQWIMTDALYSEFTEDRLLNTHKIAPADMKGTLLVTPSQGPAGSPLLERFFTLLARERGVNQTATVDTYSTFVYDAIWGIARAVKSLNAKSALGFTNSTALLQELLAITYEGASGIVSFDEKGDRENMPYSIFNWNAGTSDPFRSVGSWEGQIVINQSNIIFSDGTSNAVLDSVPTPIETLWYSTTIGGIVTAISVVLLVLMCITVVLLIIYRQNRLIIASSPVFLGFILGGCILAIMSNFFWFGEPSVAKCYFRTWFGFLGFALSTGSLLAKNGRLWYLFNQKTLRAVAITNQQLAIYLFVVVAPQVILLILWSAVSPFQIQNVVNVTQTSSLRLCISDGDKIFLPISIAYMGLLFVTGAFMSFKTRKLPQIFRESQWIALINYNYLFVATIAIAVSYGIQTEPLIGIGITTLAVLFAAGVNWALIFITKFYLIIFRPEAVSDMKTTTASVTRSVNAMSVMKKVSAASTTESD
jgi:ABC-type branched-subunit amino acid transport system substrate-binding protein